MDKKNILTHIKGIMEYAIEAGAAIMDIYNQNDILVEEKADSSPLTLADKTANEIICKGLKKITPNIPIISEENKEISYTIRKTYDYVWIVDPLDGTKEFIKKNGEFTVNIALVKNQKVIAGVVYIPVSKQLYYAVKGLGAFRIGQGKEHQIKASNFKITDERLRIVCSRSHLNKDTEDYIQRLNDPTTVNKGSSLKFLIIAEGNADIYPRFGPTMEWDIAASHIILEEAGGKIFQENGSSILYNKENLLNPNFIASGNEQYT